MDEDRTRALLAEAARRLDEGLLLWRGAELGGGDVDLVVLPAAAGELEELLRSAGARPLRHGRHRTLWSAPGVELDILDAAGWPDAYPPLDRVLGRTERPAGLPPLAAAEDRLLVFAADLLAGRPVEKMLRRAEPLLERPGVRERLARIAASEGRAPLARLIANPDRVRRLARRGRLPYGRSALLAWRSAPGRAALAGRVVARLRTALPWRRGLLITVSGMDGAGKSTAAAVARERLEAHGLEAEVVWNRFVDADTRTLDRIAAPVKRLLRRREGLADPVAVRGDAAAGTPRARTRSPVGWSWVVVVAAVNVQGCRRAARRRRRANIVCDRWAADSLVDLEVRYGRHQLASSFIRRALPAADLSLFIAVDAATAAARKPGDQSIAVLSEMEPLYDAHARELGLVRIDGRGGRDEVERLTSQAVDGLLATLPPGRLA